MALNAKFGVDMDLSHMSSMRCFLGVKAFAHSVKALFLRQNEDATHASIIATLRDKSEVCCAKAAMFA